MAVPARRISKSKKRSRRSHAKLTVTGLVTCPNCGALIKAHHVCPKCGYYGGKQVLENGKPYVAKEESVDANAGKKSARNRRSNKKS